jgi:hypothetical protein
MPTVVRIDLAALPWTGLDGGIDATHEITMLLRLLELGRRTGHRFHFFSTAASLRAFPMSAEAILTEGHVLDWLADGEEATDEVLQAFLENGVQPTGAGLTQSEVPELPDWVRFTCGPGQGGSQVKHFGLRNEPLRDALLAGQTYAGWLAAAGVPSDESVVTLDPASLFGLDPTLKDFSAWLNQQKLTTLP